MKPTRLRRDVRETLRRARLDRELGPLNRRRSIAELVDDSEG